jgi:hypothetical protein
MPFPLRFHCEIIFAFYAHFHLKLPLGFETFLSMAYSSLRLQLLLLLCVRALSQFLSLSFPLHRGTINV